MFAPKVAKAQTKAAGNPTGKMTPHRSTVVGHRLGHGPVEQVPFPQRSIGNQATLRLLGQQTSRPAASNPPGDYEHEADRVVDQGVRVPLSSAPARISRKCAACEGEEKLQKKSVGPQSAAGELVSTKRGFDFGKIRIHADMQGAEVAGRSGVSDVGVLPDSEGNEFGDTGQLPGPAPQPAPTPTADASCGCCVNSVSISNIAPFDNAGQMGHSFDLAINMAYPMVLRSPGSGHCTLQWFERTNVPYFPSMVANQWNDMFALVPGSPTLAPWVNRDETCGGGAGVQITDPPALGKRPGRTVTRTLDFNIVVSSSSAGCGHASASATATQTLTMVNGAANWAASSFRVG